MIRIDTFRLSAQHHENWSWHHPDSKIASISNFKDIFCAFITSTPAAQHPVCRMPRLEKRHDPIHWWLHALFTGNWKEWREEGEGIKKRNADRIKRAHAQAPGASGQTRGISGRNPQPSRGGGVTGQPPQMPGGSRSPGGFAPQGQPSLGQAGWQPVGSPQSGSQRGFSQQQQQNVPQVGTAGQNSQFDPYGNPLANPQNAPTHSRGQPDPNGAGQNYGAFGTGQALQSNASQGRGVSNALGQQYSAQVGGPQPGSNVFSPQGQPSNQQGQYPQSAQAQNQRPPSYGPQVPSTQPPYNRGNYGSRVGSRGLTVGGNTAAYEVGNMNRTYLDGMVPAEELKRRKGD